MRATLVVLLCLGVAAALEGLFYLVRYLSDRGELELKRRLRLLGTTADQRETLLLRPERYAASPGLARFVRALPGSAGFERLLMEADSKLTVAQLQGLSLALFVGALGALLVLGTGALPTLLVAGLAGTLPVAFTWIARSRRSDRLSEQLPEALDMMTRSLRAGHSLSAAFRLVASEMAMPASVEFGRAYEEQNLGLGVEQAVFNMTRRCPLNRDLKIFAVSIAVQKETGGNLAEILENIAATVRDRYRFFAKLRALTAEGRTSAMVLGSLPLAMMLFLLVANPTYLGRLFDNTPGQLILVYAGLSWSLGGLWMFRMSKVEF